jgi:hypothetical protein
LIMTNPEQERTRVSGRREQTLAVAPENRMAVATDEQIFPS